MQIVNGYVCATSCDVAAAKKGHDPKNPHDDPVKAAQLGEAKALATGKPVDQPPETLPVESGFAVDAVQFGGRLSGLSAARGSATAASPLVDVLA
jgi:hypothetical protein